eukprot:TRINITY_DN12492_c0_g1_i1.p1 TRINITY_DN12492_c0_g1~~TRINITY_DN12492_c0_g1_i1.p1  ORF type:complete len:306 (+),score=52.17 TRINITY_DN12492_c0_g1_i1:49-966(+)
MSLFFSHLKKGFVHEKNVAYNLLLGKKENENLKKWSLLFTCEHASNKLPHEIDNSFGVVSDEEYSLKWSESDNKIKDLHWGYDPFAIDITCLLLDRLSNKNDEKVEINDIQDSGSDKYYHEGVNSIFSTTSRLYIDVNRPLNSDTMFRTRCDNETININENLTKDIQNNRINSFYHPFHNKIKELSSLYRPKTIFSMHSFTDMYEGKKREMEIGVLYNKNETLGNIITEELKQLGHYAVENEPWSGKSGLAHSADSHSQNINPNSNAIMFEFRQDLLQDENYQKRVVDDLYKILSNPKYKQYFKP